MVTPDNTTFRTWPVTSRQLRRARGWFLFAAATTLPWLGLVSFLHELAQPGPRPATGILGVFVLSMLGSVFLIAVVASGILGCLPGFLLLPWLMRRLPWLDQGWGGAAALSLLLPVPGVLAIGAVWGFELPALVFSYALGLLSIATPRIILKSLHAGAFGSDAVAGVSVEFDPNEGR
jgi:hypothetical protein